MVVRGSQEKMWRVIDKMSKEIQELVQRGASIKGEEETELLPASENPAEDEVVLVEASTMAQPIQ